MGEVSIIMSKPSHVFAISQDKHTLYVQKMSYDDMDLSIQFDLS